MKAAAETPKRWIIVVLGLAVVGAVVAVYWPIGNADFVWDDIVCLHDRAWLSRGELWKSYVLRDFCGWTNYFRPLAVLMFVAEVRIFDVSPGAMHWVSLALHVANTLLVGRLASSLGQQISGTSTWRVGAAMLVYGLHPALVEPVAWISSQTELLLTSCILLGCLCNAAIDLPFWRAVSVGTCFFLAACTKESAIAFPIVLLLLDWLSLRSTAATSAQRPIYRLLRWQWRTYLAVLIAGLTYLDLRYRALGHLVAVAPISDESLPGRMADAARAILIYWRIMVWPMAGLAPVHPVDSLRLDSAAALTAAGSVAVGAVLLVALLGALRRKPAGILILAATATLLPAAHLVPVAFDSSFYHERYAMTALAIACAMLPVLRSPPLLPPLVRACAPVLAALWLVVAVANIRATLPLWANEYNLWRWALRMHPDSVEAQEHLLSYYVMRNDREHAHALADKLIADPNPCADCLLNIAYLAMSERDTDRASAALDTLGKSRELANDQRLLHGYIVAQGVLRELRGDDSGAEGAYRDAIVIDSSEPVAHMNLALLLVKQGKLNDAQSAADIALALFAPDVREARRAEFKKALANSTAAGK